MDGETALWDECRVWFAEAVGILDLFHVLERLWAVAHCFHREGSEAAEEFVHRYPSLPDRELVALLSSDLASWITGACIDVDGGWVKSIV